ncbi:hypothetical protein ACT8ZV_17160 [Nocardioides sp. MAHUQ-72]|uniref:hypothetical protein n=1 Tax=unclassified Nocardioides TaxID=2615069 RepID=UPI0036236F82
MTLDPWAHYRVGSQIFTDYTPDYDYFHGRFFLRWTTGDPSGVCSQRVAWQGYDNIGGPEDPVLGEDTVDYPVTARARTFDFSTNIENWWRIPDRFVVRSRDCAGNTGTSNIADTQFGTREDDGPGISYRGTWSTSRFSGFSGGTTHWTSRAGDSFTATFDGDGPIGLVMEKAPDRGKADVYVDGVLRKTIDTHATTTKHRIVVWQGLFKSGPHTLRVVNKATAGHPRIDLDTLLTCSGAHHDFLACP